MYCDKIIIIIKISRKQISWKVVVKLKLYQAQRKGVTSLHVPLCMPVISIAPFYSYTHIFQQTDNKGTGCGLS